MALIVFNETTDYAKAEAEVKHMYSEQVAETCSCNCNEDVKDLCGIAMYLEAIEIDKGTNVARYKKDVEAAYNLLSNNCC